MLDQTQSSIQIATGQVAGWPWSLELVTPKPFTEWPDTLQRRFNERYQGCKIADAEPEGSVARVRLRVNDSDSEIFTAHLNNRFDVVSAGSWAPDIEDSPDSPALLFGACAPQVTSLEWATADDRYTATPTAFSAPHEGGWYMIALSARDLARGTVVGRDAGGEELTRWGTSRLLLEGPGYLSRRLGSITPIGHGEVPGGGQWELSACADEHAIAYALTKDGRPLLVNLARLPAPAGVRAHPRLSPPDRIEPVLGTVGKGVHEVHAEHADGSPGELIRIEAPDLPVDLFLAWSTNLPLERVTAIDDRGKVINESSNGHPTVVRPA